MSASRQRSLDILKSWARVLTDEDMTQTQAHNIAENCREFAVRGFQREHIAHLQAVKDSERCPF